MPLDLFSTVNTIIHEADLPRKRAALQELQQIWQNTPMRTIFFEQQDLSVEPVGNPSFAALCCIVHGSQVPRRRNLDTLEGRIIFLHALAHIEYSAIDLALDAVYRFRNLPEKFYDDFLNVAFDEMRHFTMLEQLLSELSAHYGFLPVHTGIHDAMARSQHSLRVRMAATHRHLEANGLDAHPELARKFMTFTDPFAEKVRAALGIIFEDEINHVRVGDYWFRYACAKEGVSTDTFVADVESAIPGAKFGKKSLNIDARKRAGFTDRDIALLEN
ncbi:MAG TPA: ferritin-like domain-containing protein [Turneriella sp.]|nr:ferritin-like domain-containing protein [Turneriella sp.]